MSSSLITKVKDVSNGLALMRQVSVTIYYSQEASPEWQSKTGRVYSNVVSENFCVLPPKVDRMDVENLEFIRDLWLKSAQQRPVEDAANLLARKEETSEEMMLRLIGDAQSRQSRDLMVQFIRSARYPIPSEFSVRLPERDKSFRKEIIGTLVPFVETRNMLLRLEDTLELPMRSLSIGHGQVAAVDQLKATFH